MQYKKIKKLLLIGWYNKNALIEFLDREDAKYKELDSYKVKISA